MFQDLENKAYAVSFKAGSIGKGGHKGERGSSGRGGGDGRSTRMTANVSLQTFRHVFINDQRENKWSCLQRLNQRIQNQNQT